MKEKIGAVIGVSIILILLNIILNIDLGSSVSDDDYLNEYYQDNVRFDK